MNGSYYYKLKSTLIFLINKKFTRDTLCLFASTFTFGICGILINILIGREYGSSGLGIFSQSLAIYTVLSIVGAFGITESVVKHTPTLMLNTEVLGEMLSSAVLFVFFFSSAVGLLFHFTTVFLQLPFSLDVIMGTKTLLIGLPLFCINKILFSYINGRRDIIVYSVAQTARWLLLFTGSLFLTTILNFSLNSVMLIFPLTEAIIACALMWYVNRSITVRIPSKMLWTKNHVGFGNKLVLATFLNEVKDKMDILVSGILLPSSVVGSYAFASSIAKGLLSIASSVQTNFNPIISNLWNKQQYPTLKISVAIIEKVVVGIVATACVCLLLIYPYLLGFFAQDTYTYQSTAVLIILLLGIVFATPGTTIGAVFTMIGKPTMQLQISFILFLITLLTTLLLVKAFGVIGTAVATSLSYLLLTVMLKVSFNREVNRYETK